MTTISSVSALRAQRSAACTVPASPRRHATCGNDGSWARITANALLSVYNALVDQAVAAAVDLNIDPDEISFTAVLRATRDHLIAAAGCGHRGGFTDLRAAIVAAPRNRVDHTRTSPRTTKQRRTQRTRERHLY